MNIFLGEKLSVRHEVDILRVCVALKVEDKSALFIHNDVMDEMNKMSWKFSSE